MRPQTSSDQPDTGSDRLLARIERDAVRACIGVAIVAAVVARHWNPPLAVLGGGLLTAISYRGIHAGVSLLAAAARDRANRLETGRKSTALALFRFFTRYAILAVAAYVMMVRLRLHPGWLLAGASALVLAIGVEAIRVARAPRPRRAP